MRAARHLRIAIVLAVATAAVAEGCLRRGAQPYAPDQPISLLVRNHAFLDMAVFALPSAIDSRIRVGTVTGLTNQRFVVPAHALRPGGVLVVYIHPIGGDRHWTSPDLPLSEGTIAALDIYMDRTGSLDRSALFVAPDTMIDAMRRD